MALARDIHHGRHRSKQSGYPSTRKRLNREGAELLRRAIQLTDDPTREAWCSYDLAGALRWSGGPNAEVEQAFLNAMSLRPDEQLFKDGYERWKRRSL